MASEQGRIVSSNRNDRANLAGLLICLLSIISICLTAFNVYLLVWVCSTLTSGNGQLPATGLSLLDQLELLGGASKRIKLNERLLAKKPLLVSKIRQDHLMSPESSLRLVSENKITFKTAPRNQSSSFSVSSRRNSLEFPSGLLVFGLPNKVPMIDCLEAQARRSKANRARPEEAETQSVCRLRTRQLKLTNPTGLDFFNLKSIQTNRLRTRRLHSPLQKLQLMTSSSANIESLDDDIQLQALDLLSMGRRHSAESSVIIKAKSINLGALEEHKTGRPPRADPKMPPLSGNGSNHFKLCICLSRQSGDVKSEQKGSNVTKLWAPNNGRVFAIQNQLKCSKFSERFCNTVTTSKT